MTVHLSRRLLILALFYVCIGITTLADQLGAPSWRERMAAGETARKNRQYEVAAKEFELALNEAESFGAQDQRLIETIDRLATINHLQKKFDEAERLYRRALALEEARYGTEHRIVADRLVTLSGLYFSQPGRRSQADLPLLRALNIREKGFGAESSEVAVALIQLGYQYGLTGRDSEAEPFMLRALYIQERTFGIQSPNLETVLTYLAAIRIRQTKLDEAEALYQRVQSVLELALTGKTPEKHAKSAVPRGIDPREYAARGYAARLQNLTRFYTSQRRYAEAEKQYIHALKVLEREFGRDHFTIAMVIEPYAALLRTLDRAGEAGNLEERAKSLKKPTVIPQ